MQLGPKTFIGFATGIEIWHKRSFWCWWHIRMIWYPMRKNLHDWRFYQMGASSFGREFHPLRCFLAVVNRLGEPHNDNQAKMPASYRWLHGIVQPFSFTFIIFLPVDSTAEGECFAILYLISPLFFWRSPVKILFSLKQEHDEWRWRVDANGEQGVERAHVQKYDPCEWMCLMILFACSHLSFLN